ncbi:MAG TPA: tetraacyldisaccharide 4'-kinase [Pusillimonas sp.]|uniref:tetraacyldisaccharide 4'-kinase n=1 Tax=Pusillimonas sp. TaxID=3040095 RepID=UPI002BF033F0|nr:tetraacyldisaccharide 4'-kinase [Pusillimonas sp.]HUH86833.1 tetraacyldisaccharide 4'-kinase [Pusillimonas sp.]
MKLPNFFLARVHALWQEKGPLSTALLPLAWITARVVKARKRRAGQNVPEPGALPTIVVGNLLVGGTGKTPVVIAVVQHLQRCGWTPGVISRGYGANVGARPRSGQGLLDPAQFGDEPALIAQVTGVPICVHPKRSQARNALASDFPAVDVVVSDDGLQHLALSRDIEIVVQDGRGVGNGRLLPAGPLREPPEKLAEVDFIINNTQDALSSEQSACRATGLHTRLPEQIGMGLQATTVENLTTGTRVPWPDWLGQHAAEPVAAVAAIGQPSRFFSMLSAAGLRLSTTVALPDHHAYAQSPFATLTEKLILVTAKDAVKCRRFSDPRVWAIHVEARFSDPLWLDRLSALIAGVAQEKNPESIKL